MCGRFVLASDAKVLAGHFKAAVLPEIPPRFNICPTHDVPIVRAHAGQREISLARWGLVPSWAKDPGIGSRMINARSETAAEKPAYRAAMKTRRCIVPADGFYEWTGPKGQKQPHYIQLADESLMGLAGLWERWRDPDGHDLETCAILTTAANEMMGELHDRMPVILDAGDYGRWLDAEQEAGDLLRPYPSEMMIHRPVSNRVNNVRNDDATLLEADAGHLFQ